MRRDSKGLLRKAAPYVPAGVKRYLRGKLDTLSYFQRAWAEDDPFQHEPDAWACPGSPVTVGIIREFTHRHSFSIAACREMGLSYRLMDMAHPEWVKQFRESDCDFFVVWPSAFLGIWKEMFDERLWILTQHLGRKVYPTFDETFIFENKRRVHDWIEAYSLPHPETWVFFERDQALAFARTCPLPIVVKTPRGACASGVSILRSREKLLALTRRYFGEGIVPDRAYKWDAQRLTILFQEYLPDVEEWRMIRIGESFFGYRKEKTGDFHSGSHGWSWLDPGPELLDFLRRVTDAGKFTSMNVDVFRRPDGTLLVNELQTVFGATNPADMLVIDGKPGRYVYDKEAAKWIFEEGDFCRNHCANLRLSFVTGRPLRLPTR
jgi:hypothetical protein